METSENIKFMPLQPAGTLHHDPRSKCITALSIHESKWILCILHKPFKGASKILLMTSNCQWIERRRVCSKYNACVPEQCVHVCECVHLNVLVYSICIILDLSVRFNASPCYTVCPNKKETRFISGISSLPCKI